MKIFNVFPTRLRNLSCISPTPPLNPAKTTLSAPPAPLGRGGGGRLGLPIR